MRPGPNCAGAWMRTPTSSWTGVPPTGFTSTTAATRVHRDTRCSTWPPSAASRRWDWNGAATRGSRTCSIAGTSGRCGPTMATAATTNRHRGAAGWSGCRRERRSTEIPRRRRPERTSPARRLLQDVAMAHPAGTLWTIGHSTRAWEEFAGMLVDAGIEVLADVRRFAGSRRNPQFSPLAMGPAPADMGVEYLPMPEVGGRRNARPDSPHGAWRAGAVRACADHRAAPDLV